jgi:hypothetical protein
MTNFMGASKKCHERPECKADAAQKPECQTEREDFEHYPNTQYVFRAAVIKTRIFARKFSVIGSLTASRFYESSLPARRAGECSSGTPLAATTFRKNQERAVSEKPCLTEPNV